MGKEGLLPQGPCTFPMGGPRGCTGQSPDSRQEEGVEGGICNEGCACHPRRSLCHHSSLAAPSCN